MTRGTVLAAVVAVASAVLLVAFAIVPLRALAPAGDEVAHVAGAYHLALTNSNAVNIEHPPVAKRISAIGLQLAGITARGDPGVPIVLDQWAYGRWLLYPDQQRYDAGAMHAARAPFVALALFALAGVFLVARRLWGNAGAALSATLFALSPVTIAHAGLVLTDLAIATFAVWTLYAYLVARASSRPDDARALVALFFAGMSAALALLSKATGVLVVLLLLSAWILDARGRGARVRYRGLAAIVGGIVVGAWIANGFAADFGETLQGFAAIGHNHGRGYVFHALDAASADGFWWYFPLVLLLKSTYAELAAVALAGALVVVALTRGEPTLRRRALLVLAFPCAYLLLLAVAAPNIGSRYTVPIYPFVIVAAGALFVLVRDRRIAGSVAVGLCALQLVGAWQARFDPLSHFNGLLGCRGPAAAYCLDDSSADWGQNLGRIEAAISPPLAEGDALYLMYHGTGMPEHHIPRVRPMLPEDWSNPRPGVYAVSSHLANRIRISGRRAEAPLFERFDEAAGVGTSYFLLDLRSPR